MSELPARLARPLARADALAEMPSNTDKVLTQLSLLGLSAVDGVKNNLKEASDDKPMFAAKLAGAAAAGAYLTRAAYICPFARMAIVPSMTALFGLDLFSRGANTAGAMVDTWSHPENFEKNKAALEPVIGGGIFDYTAYGLAGSAGIRPMYKRFDTDSLTALMGKKWSNLPESSIQLYKTPFKVPTPTQIHDLNTPEAAFFLQHRPSIVQIKKSSGAGSGFFVDRHLVATSYHVVRGSRWIDVINHEGNKSIGFLIARDKAADLALIRVHEPAPQVVKLGNADQLKAGAKVFSIGHPLGIDRPTLSEGKFRKLEEINFGSRKIYRSDSRLGAQYGSSGSPLFNESGEVVSIVSMASASRASGEHSAHLKALIDATRPHMGLPGGHWVNVRTSASGEPAKGELTSITTIAHPRTRFDLAEKFHDIAIEASWKARQKELTWRTGLGLLQIPSPNNAAIKMVGAESYSQRKIKQLFGTT